MHVVGTAGHVDHGKSTLVRALTGIDPDRFEEEKRRGLTIDLGFAWCTLPSGREIGIVDVPGHERFIRNMLAGVGGIDAAIFVVAADEGWKPQSAEHLQILDFLDVRAGIVALTKIDIATDATVAATTDDISARLRDTALRDAAIVPVSATSGAGLEEVARALDDVLAGAGERSDRARPRLFVDRSFTIAGAGTVVTGTLTGGALRVGDEVVLLPDERRARIRSLQTHRSSVDEAVPGSRVAANLAGLDRRSVRRGDALVTGEWISSGRFAARLRAARGLSYRLEERGAYELFVGSAQTLCRLKFLEGGSELPAGGSILVEVFADRALPIVPGDRFVIRDVGRWETVAGGIVIDQAPSRLRRRDETAIDRIKAREDLGGGELVARLVTERGVIAYRDLAALTGAGPDELTNGIDDAGERVASGYVISSERARMLQPAALHALESFHAEHPLAPGMPVDDLCSVLGIDRATFGEISGSWAVVREGNAVRLAGRGAGLTSEQREAADRALGTLRTAHASPPSLRELGLPPDVARAMERTGELVFLTPDIAYPADVWSDLQRRVVDLIASHGPVTVSQVREAVGTSRKYAVPLLERLDASGVTRRSGDVRELGPRGRELSAPS
jgi:selenocysteine-specific elongation factor